MSDASPASCGGQWSWWLPRDERVRGKELGRLLDPHLTRDRTHRHIEPVDRLLGLEHVDDPEPVLALPRRVDKNTLEREIGRCFEPLLSVGHAPNDLFVPLSS